MVPPVPRDREEVDELAALVEPPDLDLVLAVVLLPDPVFAPQRRAGAVDVGIVPAPQLHGVLLDDREEVGVAGDPAFLKRRRPDDNPPVAPRADLVQDGG